jgi:hypothetical protein
MIRRSALAVFSVLLSATTAAADPGTQVGILEVIQVVDAGNSRAPILTLNTGVRPEFSDIVRAE